MPILRRSKLASHRGHVTEVDTVLSKAVSKRTSFLLESLGTDILYAIPIMPRISSGDPTIIIRREPFTTVLKYIGPAVIKRIGVETAARMNPRNMLCARSARRHPLEQKLSPSLNCQLSLSMMPDHLHRAILEESTTT